MATNDTGGGLTMHRGRDLTTEERRKATRFVSVKAHDAQDCAQLLAMLGLTPPGHTWGRTSIAAGLRNRHKTTTKEDA